MREKGELVFAGQGGEKMGRKERKEQDRFQENEPGGIFRAGL